MDSRPDKPTTAYRFQFTGKVNCTDEAATRELTDKVGPAGIDGIVDAAAIRSWGGLLPNLHHADPQPPRPGIQPNPRDVVWVLPAQDPSAELASTRSRPTCQTDRLGKRCKSTPGNQHFSSVRATGSVAPKRIEVKSSQTSPSALLTVQSPGRHNEHLLPTH